ncbi:hypothetical protein J6590_058251 [Homalodisca vitripennis]|nr:hypothetical protein J6590_058251 [Homalodisca vitripennis]
MSQNINKFDACKFLLQVQYVYKDCVETFAGDVARCSGIEATSEQHYCFAQVRQISVLMFCIRYHRLACATTESVAKQTNRRPAKPSAVERRMDNYTSFEGPKRNSCLNLLVQRGTTPDYHDDLRQGKLHGCTCRAGDNTVCSYADCVNYGRDKEPFYLHPPTQGSVKDSPPVKDGLYINPMTVTQTQSQTHSFYLHNPHEVPYHRVKDLFSPEKSGFATYSKPPPPPPPPPLTGMPLYSKARQQQKNLAKKWERNGSPATGSLLTACSLALRTRFAWNRVNWAVNDLKNILFPDKTRVSLSSPNGQKVYEEEGMVKDLHKSASPPGLLLVGALLGWYTV